MSATEPLRHLRASTANKRPTPAAMADGQLALNTNNTSPGLFFKDSNGALVKVGPVHVGTTAPNASPAAGGSTGNAIGEQWLDTAGGTYVFKVWDGSAWRSESGTFVDVNGDVMTGALGIIAGSASAPGLYFSGDTNTGLFSPGADQVAISTGGSGRLFVDASGNIGVGSPSNGNRLDVKRGDNSFLARFYQEGAGFNADILINNVASASNFLISRRSSGESWFYNSGADPLVFHTNAQERLRITSAGLVGVGTSVPSRTLDVAGTIRSTTGVAELDNATQYKLLSFHHSGTRTGVVSYDNTNNWIYINAEAASSQMLFGTAGSERLRIDSSGRVGIGTSSPGYTFQVQSGFGITTDGVTGETRLIAKDPNSNFYKFFSFYTQGANYAERMRIDDQGRVGIGTTSPGAALDVRGGSRFYADSNGLSIDNIGRSADNISIIRFLNNAVSTELGRVAHYGNDLDVRNLTANSLTFGTNNTERARIDSSGRLLVGTSSAQGNALLQVVGDSTSSTTYPQFTLRRALAASTLGASNYIGEINFQELNGGVYGSIRSESDGSGGTNDYPGRLVFSVTRDGSASPTEAVRINNLGALKASTTSAYNGATNKVHELRNDHNDWLAMFSNTNASPKGVLLSFTGASPNGTGNEYLYCDDSTALRASIRSNGGLANFQANNVNLSDRNAKKDVSPAADTWDCLKQWEIVNYRYKDQPDDADLNLGVIAQQVAESCPEVITVFQEAKDDQPEKLGVKEQQMYWMAIKALQEAQVRIEQLEAKVSVLESKP